MARTLYLSYDGMLEPLGQSQVMAYLEPLAQHHQVWLISFEKPQDRTDQLAMAAIRLRFAQSGIQWHPLRYHKHPSGPATLWDILVGTGFSIWLVLRHRIALIHARSYVAAVMALWTKRVTGVSFLFDMRGFWADERVEGGLWRRDGRLYAVAKAFERRFFRRADHVVVLTHAARDWLMDKHDQVSVIPTCADLDRFVPGGPQTEPFVLGYVGSFGTWYLLPETLAFFNAVRRLKPDAQLLIVNRNEHDLIQRALQHANVPTHCVTALAASHAEVPELVQKMSAACAFYRPSFSKLGTAPTKIAEYLGCGVPCVGNAGIGDVAHVLRDDAGVVLERFSADDLNTAAKAIVDLSQDPKTPQRCRARAQEVFSLTKGVKTYDAIWQSLGR